MRLQAGPDPWRLRRGRRPGRRLRRPGRDGRHPRRLRLADDPRPTRTTYARSERPAAPAARLPVRPVACRRSYTFADECDAAGWYGEETLDVEAVHAMAPAANILYVGAPAARTPTSTPRSNTVVDNELAAGRQQLLRQRGRAVVEGGRRRTSTRRSCRPRPRASACCSPPVTTATRWPTPARGRSTTRPPTPTRPRSAARHWPSTKDNGYGFEQGWGTGKSTLTNGAWVPQPPAYLYGGGGGTSRLFTQPVVPEQGRPVLDRELLRQGRAPRRAGRGDGR